MTEISTPAPRGALAGVGRVIKERVQDLVGSDGSATYLWPRWLVLRAVGLVYVIIFAGLLDEGNALIGPRGVVPIGEFFAHLRSSESAFSAFVGAPSLFWLNSGEGMIRLLTWLGLASAAAVVLNLWPRLALFSCWLIFLSFVSALSVFSPAQLDDLMLEVALLCIPFAPSGLRPGLGAHSSPRPLVMFMVRWLLFRVMIEAGLVKLVAGDPHWRNLTAMEVMYETSPFPTIFGYLDFHLPKAYHVFEIGLTFAAELLAPVLALLAGRRGRWFAFVTWSLLQLGIQLTSNFGWLNVSALALGLLWLDDQMLAALAGRLRLVRVQGVFAAVVRPAAYRVISPWKSRALSLALWAHFYVAGFYLAKAAGVPIYSAPTWLSWPVTWAKGLSSANEYSLYAKFDKARYQVDFEGSNDNGRTWRTYDYRYLPQRLDRICPFIAPWFPRFEASLQIAAWGERKARVFPVVASHLLADNRLVVGLFPRNPFPDRPPTVIRMKSSRMAFTDRATQQSTGHYWRKEALGDYLPGLYVGEGGEILTFSVAPGDAALQKGDAAAAFAYFSQQYQLGNLEAGYRLADLYTRGLGVKPDPARVFALFTDLVAKGATGAEHNLGVCHEYGVGVPVDFAKAAELYRRAANRGNVLSLFNLAALHVKDRLLPRDDVEGLALLIEALARAQDESPQSKFIRDQQPRLLEVIQARMRVDDITQARLRATARLDREPAP